jgi:hypothetical protein
VASKVNYKEIGDFIGNTIVGCKFVGISSDRELFVEFDHDDFSLRLNAAELLQAEFPEIGRVTFIERVNIKQAKEMVDELNKFLEDLEKKERGLLDIGSFK